MSLSTKTLVFNIQKFSLHDGPGIRTVVFLKGCPLRCKWCANPESQEPSTQILWDSTQCLCCGQCVSVCSEHAITTQTISNKSQTDINATKTQPDTMSNTAIVPKTNITISHSKCIGCLSCVSQCPGHALKAEGEEKTIEEVVSVCLQDKDFYLESDGGVTISGGEALMHPEFTRALQIALKEHDIHTAIETTGYAKREDFDYATEYTDLILFDVKHWDAAKHFEGTGVFPGLIHDNLKYAISCGKDVLPRIPVIPGFNDSKEDAIGFSSLLKSLGATKVQLLPFHQFGEKKYESLGKEYEYVNISALHEEDLEEYKNTFIENGIEAFF